MRGVGDVASPSLEVTLSARVETGASPLFVRLFGVCGKDVEGFAGEVGGIGAADVTIRGVAPLAKCFDFVLYLRSIKLVRK